MSRIRVLIADDHTIVRSGVRLLLSSQTDLEVVGEAANADEALAACRADCPDVLLLDLSMGGSNPLKMVPALREACPRTQVLVLTMHDDRAYLRAALAAGCAGFLIKSISDDELVAAIRAAARGETYIDQRLRGAEEEGARDAGPDGAPARLSEREQQVLKLLAYGLTNQDIANRLFLSVKTVETYRARIMEKLNLKNRADLVRYTLDVGLLDPNRAPPELPPA